MKEQELKEKGYVKFTGAVHSAVFDYFQCAHPRKARWYFKDGWFVCSGCDLACETDDPEGFQAFLYEPQK
ncbi:MAG: DNA-binding protein [Desulfovibrionaceae bacterium]